jgi:hypothetical protein
VSLPRILLAAFAFGAGSVLGSYLTVQLTGMMLALSKFLHDKAWRMRVAHADYCLLCGGPCHRLLQCQNHACGHVHFPDSSPKSHEDEP